MNKKREKFIVDIAPITPLPLTNQQIYSYLWTEKIPVGSLVSVSFFHRTIEGIVINNRSDFHRLGNIELKNITKIIEENFLTIKQIELAEFISQYYFSPLGKVLKFFIPKRVKSRNAYRKSRIVDCITHVASIDPTKEQRNAVQKITLNDPRSTIYDLRFLLFGPASSGKTEVYIHSVLKLKAKSPKSQFLILLPELTLTPQAIERYGEYFKQEEIAVLHSKMPKGQFYANWQKIKSGEAKIIIGSRMAVFSPFKRLGLIVVDEEQDISFKQWDMNPRYDARTVAEKLSELHQCPLVFGSATPRVEDYWKAKNNNYKLLTLPLLKTPSTKIQVPNTKIELIDMKKERWVRNYSPISKKLQSEIAYALKNKLQTILFINRQGMSTFSVCSECKTVLRCPKCQRALIYDKDGTYRCVHCAYKTSITPSCLKCKSITFTNIGLGTQKIEREIQNLFPTARVARADNQSMRAPRAQEILYEKFKQKEFDILIGTQMISKGWDLPNVALVGIIDGDGMLSIPDFSTVERAFSTILQAAGRTNRIGAKFPGIVLVQTFNPEQYFFKTLAEKDFEKFYTKEIDDRKNLDLPPFGKLVKLIFQDYTKNKAQQEAQRLFSLLENKKIKTTKIFEPQEAYVSNVRGRFRQQIVIKIKGNLPAELSKIISSLPHGWIVDVDPISLT